MSELERARRALARVEKLRDQQTEELSRFYYAQCAIGWRATVARLEREQQEKQPNEVVNPGLL